MDLDQTSQRLDAAANRDALFAYLDGLGLSHRTVDHQAVFTVAESRDLKAELPGGHSKNLFLKDKKSTLYLVVAHAETQVDLIGLGRAVGARGRLSFGKPALMSETLGVAPGAVTPFSLFNPSAQALAAVIVDTRLVEHNPIWFHPLENTASTAISPGDLAAFMESCGFQPRMIDLAAPNPA